MNIFGIGTDLVYIPRITALLERHGKKFVDRILLVEEQKIYALTINKQEFIAKRFAAKEAVAKALGTGIGQHLAFNEISVINLDNGKPVVQFINKANDFVKTLLIKDVNISLSDEKDYALAFVIIMC